MRKTMMFAAVASAMTLTPVAIPHAASAHAARPAFGFGPCTAAANATVDGIQGPPQSAGAVIQLRHAMFLIKTVTDYIRANCAGDPQYASQLAAYDDLYQQSLNTCRQIASDASMCGPYQYGQ